MKIISEKSLFDFPFWSGAEENFDTLTVEQVEKIEEVLDELHPEGIDETELNDIFRFDFEQIKKTLCIN